ncbi:MAG: hypothetical protein NC089_06525 [Bacteroides sp.]|nr:hypothetical protein [Bacteroides sp.]MCM1550843.1 hypothetical protein [Clostridium sp.]
MRKKSMVTLILIVVLFIVCNTKVSAAWAQVTAVLPADKKTVSSGFAMFVAEDMYCQTNKISDYPIKFEAIRSNDSTVEGKAYNQVIVNVGQEVTWDVHDEFNYHKIRLTGWNINSAVKGCIGYGYITD